MLCLHGLSPRLSKKNYNGKDRKNKKHNKTNAMVVKLLGCRGRVKVLGRHIVEPQRQVPSLFVQLSYRFIPTSLSFFLSACGQHTFALVNFTVIADHEMFTPRRPRVLTYLLFIYLPLDYSAILNACKTAGTYTGPLRGLGGRSRASRHRIIALPLDSLPH